MSEENGNEIETEVREKELAPSTVAAQPDKITPRHRALMRRLIAGMTPAQAGEDLGFSASRVSVITGSPLFQREMKRMQQELDSTFIEAESDKVVDKVRKDLEDSADMAARTLRGALNDDNAAVRISAAKDILDRTGYAKEDKIKARVLVEPSQALINVVGRIVKERDAGANQSEPTGDDKECVAE